MHCASLHSQLSLPGLDCTHAIAVVYPSYPEAPACNHADSQRNRFDIEAAHNKLIDALAARLNRGLHGSIPAPPTPLWTLLPYTGRKACVDHLGHPVVVLSLRDVARDDTGSLDELKDWTWWGLELVRRALKEYWVDGRRGTGAEGAVLIIDAAHAGYRNLVSLTGIRVATELAPDL